MLFRKEVLLVLYTLLPTLAWGIQIPFLNSIGNEFLKKGDNDEHRLHYSLLDEEELPINLSQYSGESIIRVDFTDNLELLKFLHGRHNDIKFKKWGNNNIEKSMDIQIDQDNLGVLKSQFPKLSYTTILEDLSQKIFETFPRDYKPIPGIATLESIYAYEHKIINQMAQLEGEDIPSDFFFQEYRPLGAINTWLDLIAEKYSNLITIEDIGQTYEHRTYRAVHLSTSNDSVDHSDKKTIVITGGVHAREWISVSSVLYAIYMMIMAYEENPSDVTFSKLDFLFVPVSNPDGYAYTWSSDRLWRKNRQETTVPRCFGIDIDHSFDFHWKHSDWPCGEEYSGESPFEALESRIWNDYLNQTNYNHSIYGYIDLHSYAQEVLFPYAYSCDKSPRDEENLIELAYGISKAIRMQSGKNYNVLPACIDKDTDLLPDMGAGTSLDFMYHNQAFWAYQFKLRDSGSHGFLLPRKYIEPVGREVFAGIKYFCKFLLSDD